LNYNYSREFSITPFISVNGFQCIRPKLYFTGDFTGRGKTEVLAISHTFYKNNNKEQASRIYLFDLDANLKLYEGETPFDYNLNIPDNGYLNLNESNRILIIDYDGDGKSDICLINDSGMSIYTFERNGNTLVKKGFINTTIKQSSVKDRHIVLQDFNCDGKTDILISCPYDGNHTDHMWKLFYSKGDATFETKSIALKCALPDITSDVHRLQVASNDVNGDGYPDIIFNYSPSNKVYTAINRYGSFLSNHPVLTNNSSYVEPSLLVQGGTSNKIHVLQKEEFRELAYLQDAFLQTSMTKVVNSMGVAFQAEYGRISEKGSNSYYTKGTGTQYPYEDYQGSLPVLRKFETYMGEDKIESLNFAYEKAIMHKQGLGFRGFEKIERTDNEKDRTFTKTFNPLQFGMMIEDDSPFSKTNNVYSITENPNKTRKINLTKQTIFNKLSSESIVINYVYDTYGYPIKSTINYEDEIVVNNSTFFHQTTGIYILGLLSKQETITTKNGSTLKKMTQYFGYSNKGLAQDKTDYVSINNAIYMPISRINYTYNNKGNVMSKKITPYASGSSLEYRYEYDNESRLTKEILPIEGIYSIFDYNTAGLLESIADHKNNLTSFDYDSWDRVTSISYPSGEIENNSYTWDDNSLSNPAHYGIRTSYTHNSQPEQSIHYDALGRETSIVTRYVDGGYRKIEKTYDRYGRLSTESLPYISGTALVTTYNYDDYDRITSIVEPSGRTTSYSYSGNSKTTVKNGISSTHEFDSRGNLITVTDSGGVIKYDLRPDGQPSSIELGNIRTSFAYDAYGRRIGITDPSAGTQTFTYDAAGNLASQTDANGKTTTMAYDQYNRLITCTCPEFTTTYT